MGDPGWILALTYLLLAKWPSTLKLSHTKVKIECMFKQCTKAQWMYKGKTVQCIYRVKLEKGYEP